MFPISIKIIKTIVPQKKYCSYALGEIIINDFKETFEAPLDWWKIEYYERQWKEGLERIKIHPTSCLITKVQNPAITPLIEWWTLYKENNYIIIRNQVIPLESYEKRIGTQSFTPNTCYNFIGPRSSKFLADGLEISEWTVDFSEI